MRYFFSTVSFCSLLKLPKLATGVFLLAALVLASCDSNLGVKVGNVAPGFSDIDIYGEPVSLSALRGKVVVLYFWSNSCCGKNLKQLEPLYRRVSGEGLAVVAIDGLDAKKEIAAFAKENGVTFTLLTDEHAMLIKQYQVLAYPTVFILDRSGVVRERILGEASSAKMEELIKRQLDLPQAPPQR